MERAIVQRRGWLSHREFLDYVSASHIIPGPIAVQLSVHLGYRRAGLAGAMTALVGFVVPAALITWVAAILYQQHSDLSVLTSCLQGIRPAVVAVIIVSVWQLAKPLRWTAKRVMGLLAVITLVLIGVNPTLVLGVAIGVTGCVISLRVRSRRPPSQAQALENDAESAPHDTGRSGRPARQTQTKDQTTDVTAEHTERPENGSSAMLLLMATAFAKASSPVKAIYLFGIFFKIGFLLYGGGNVLAAYLQSDFVERGLMSHEQILDALAIGQSTPGPVLTVATFIGYVLAGHLGAVTATLGIITPCVILATFFHPYVRRLRESPYVGPFLDVISVVVMGLILAVGIQLAVQVFRTPMAVAIAILAGASLLVFDVSPILVILAAGLIGWIAM